MRLPASRALRICLVAVALALSDCGGSSNSNPTPPIPIVETTNYTVGGTISGLTLSSVVLANGTATVTIAAGVTSWMFPTTFAPGSSYSVTVQTQPSGEQCQVTSGGSGMETGDVDNVTVLCGFGQWTWEGGSNTVNASAVYGTQGAAAAGNVPGARYSSSAWTDPAGNFWLFGGVGYGSTGTGYLNDLWQYSPSTGQWTWEGGSNTVNAGPVYGTQGTAAAGNLPGARYSSSAWTDPSGNLWLFGGVGYSSTGTVGNLNDLWRYSPSTGQWTWISGGNADNAVGVYGTQGTAAAGNVPGARYSSSAWIDSSGNLWLFGGYGYDSTGAVGKLNDLWQYTPSTGQWTWVNGEDAANAIGVYGALGNPAIINLPGARQAASTWTDPSGNFWLFGGVGYSSNGSVGNLNDLWQYSPSTKEWTWFSGGSTNNAAGVYGTQGATSIGNVLGGRDSSSSWIDSSGKLWLFGGYGYDSTGDVGYLNDLWQYNPSTGS